MLDDHRDSWVVDDAASLRKRLEDRQLEMARGERTLPEFIAVEPSDSGESGARAERRAEIAGPSPRFRGVELSFREFEMWFIHDEFSGCADDGLTE